MKKLLLLLLVFAFCSCDVLVAIDEIAQEHAQTVQREQSNRNKVIHDADVIHIMHAIGICDINVDKAASMSVTYLLCADSTVMVINDSKVNILPYSLETAKLIMLKELELANQKK